MSVYENATVVCGTDIDDAGVPIYVVCIVQKDKISGLQFVNVGSQGYEVGNDKISEFFRITAPSPMLDMVKAAWEKLQGEKRT